MANAFSPIVDTFGGNKTFFGKWFARGPQAAIFKNSKLAQGIGDPLNLTGGLTPKPPGPPDPVPVVPLPDPAAQDAARRRAIATRRAGTGRASTVFTEADSGTLGG